MCDDRFVGSFHHFLHDTIPTLLWTRRFRFDLLPSHLWGSTQVVCVRAPYSARFTLPDHPEHRAFLSWFDPALASRIEWVPVNTVVCLEPAAPQAKLLALHYQSKDNRNSSIISARSDCTIDDIHNPALSQLLVLEITIAKPVVPNRRKHVLFYRRHSSSGLAIPQEHEDFLTTIIRMSTTLPHYHHSMSITIPHYVCP